MEKLDAILRAEEAGRERVSAARTRAAETIREGREEARRVVESAESEGAAAATDASREILDAAHTDAAGIRRQGAEELARVVAGSEGRLSEAVDAVVRRLVG